jgi:hypothetical protein
MRATAAMPPPTPPAMGPMLEEDFEEEDWAELEAVDAGFAAEDDTPEPIVTVRTR